ncbi:MAG: hypothetical protein C0462_01695 [Alcanivorax sp.]|nr:hypothetical protein [Alcanivorax sp.]
MVALEDDEMAGVSGAGLAFVMDDFSMRWAPTSYIELTGATPDPAALDEGWRRGDARYYGLSITNGGIAGADWYGNGCSGSAAFGNEALACPLGIDNNYGITSLASIYDPYVLRAYQYSGHDYTGQYRDDPSGTNQMPTVMELIGPSYTDPWRWAFWGELEVDRENNVSAIGASNNSVVGGGGADFLQSQTIIHGKPTTMGVYDDVTNTWLEAPKPTILRLMRTTGQGAEADTFGITYQSALSGDFRFSVRQTANSPDLLHTVPDFDDKEGMYFKNVDAFLPLGVLHYQTINFDAVRDGSGNATGDFVIELTRIPNIPHIYNHFYCGAIENSGDCATTNGVLDSPNEETRGYVRWGDFTGVNMATGAGLPTADSVTNGIYFVGGDVGNEQVTNIGISRIEGMRIHHLKITTLGAAP